MYTKLGRSGVDVSRLCLGTMNFGPRTPEQDAHALMDEAHSAGINYFDTANQYGAPFGQTEEIIGRWFAQGGGRRERTVLATKVYGKMGSWPNEGGLSALHIRQALDASLKRLRTDYIDIYQFHHVDRATPWEEIWQAIQVAIDQGKILYVGSSNFAAWHIATAQAAAKERNLLGIVSEQSLYNLATRDIELEVIPAVQAYGLALVPWSPLAGGLLGGASALAGGNSRRSSPRAQDRELAQSERLGRFHDAAARLGHAPASVALAWLLHQPAVTAPIIGPRTVEQLHAALKALDVELHAEDLDELDEIFPGKAPAPEHYAW
jgi:aryl-alcohol dehydrogenase-like predicted oxidoreductase